MLWVTIYISFLHLVGLTATSHLCAFEFYWNSLTIWKHQLKTFSDRNPEIHLPSPGSAASHHSHSHPLPAEMSRQENSNFLKIISSGLSYLFLQINLIRNNTRELKYIRTQLSYKQKLKKENLDCGSKSNKYGGVIYKDFCLKDKWIKIENYAGQLFPFLGAPEIVIYCCEWEGYK